MTVNHEKVREMAAAYTAAWNSGSPDAVASFYAPDGKIVINRGQPWVDRKGISEMAAASLPTYRIFIWCVTTCDVLATMSPISGRLLGHTQPQGIHFELSAGKSGISMPT